MNPTYLETKIRTALEQSQGNPGRARQKIIAWAAEDPKLLYALARPHLTGIVAHAVNRVIERQDLGAEPEIIPDEPEKLDMKPETFGQELLGALQSSNTPMFGKEGFAAPLSRKKASKSHIDALRRIARKDSNNFKDDFK